MAAPAQRTLAAVALGVLALTFGGAAHAEGVVVPDRLAVRFVAPETGGVAKPRFITERELAFFARTEATIEQVAIEADVYPERYVRSATDRLVARAMLAGLYVHGGVEPPDLPRLTLEQRAELADRMGGVAVLEEAMEREGITEPELITFLRDQVRAAYYVDRAITPILAVTEDQLRETFRATLHPFRGSKYEDVKPKLRRWLVTERLRAVELEFLQSARTRIKINALILKPERPEKPEGEAAPQPARSTSR
ncbi:MAG: hypothetical protein JST00_05040 [Deltaproteobacteria bacterium]|nr:hypothetical protein [Deltaproteobacteria bacterium]